MFSALRQNSIIYILDKRGVPTLKVAQVEEFSEPKSKFNTSFPVHPYNTEMVVDITAKVGEERYEFKQLPAQASVANYEGAIVSETKEPIIAEVENLQRISRQHIADTPYHEKVDEACDKMMKSLNPFFAKEKEQEEKIVMLETKIGGIENSIDSIKSMLSDALNKKGE